MQLNHLNLSFANVPAASQVFQRHFGFRVIGSDNHAISVLDDGNGFVLVISNFEKRTEFSYPPSFHIGFIQDSVDEVHRLYEELKSAGLNVGDPPKKTPRGTTFYGHIEDTIMFEILSRE
jgi:lactoylglutathione lyase